MLPLSAAPGPCPWGNKSRLCQSKMKGPTEALTLQHLHIDQVDGEWEDLIWLSMTSLQRKAVWHSLVQITGSNERGVWKYPFPHNAAIDLRKPSCSLRRKVVSPPSESSIQRAHGEALRRGPCSHGATTSLGSPASQRISIHSIELSSATAILHSRIASSANALKSSSNI